jgi:hypothetical protein
MKEAIPSPNGRFWSTSTDSYTRQVRSLELLVREASKSSHLRNAAPVIRGSDSFPRRRAIKADRSGLAATSIRATTTGCSGHRLRGRSLAPQRVRASLERRPPRKRPLARRGLRSIPGGRVPQSRRRDSSRSESLLAPQESQTKLLPTPCSLAPPSHGRAECGQVCRLARLTQAFSGAIEAARARRGRWSSFGQVAVANGCRDPQSEIALSRMEATNRNAWQALAKPFTEIAPRRSPVRVRLAPPRRRLQMPAFRFPQRAGNDQQAPRGQVLVKLRTRLGRHGSPRCSKRLTRGESS